MNVRVRRLDCPNSVSLFSTPAAVVSDGSHLHIFVRSAYDPYLDQTIDMAQDVTIPLGGGVELMLDEDGAWP